MIGRSYPEYILIRTCIFGFRLIAPLSIAYVVASWYSGKWLLHAYLGYYASLEAIFYLCVYLPRSWLLQEVSITPMFLFGGGSKGSQRASNQSCNFTTFSLDGGRPVLSANPSHGRRVHYQRSTIVVAFDTYPYCSLIHGIISGNYPSSNDV